MSPQRESAPRERSARPANAMHTSVTLIDRLRRPGDAEAWTQFVKLYLPFVYGWLHKHVLQAADADEVAQEVMLIVFRKLPAFEHNGRTGAFRRWLHEIVEFCLRGFWSRRKLRPQAGDSDTSRRLDALEQPDASLSRLWDQEHDQYMLARMLERIQPEFAATTWEAFRRAVIEQQPPATIAADLTISVSAVYCAKSKVLRRLRRLRSDWLGEPDEPTPADSSVT